MLRNWSLNPLAKVAIAILRKYGADAHVYVPGVGAVNGLTAGNYLDSAGTTAATVDNPVGLSLDALQAMTLGANLAPATHAAFNGTINQASIPITCTSTASGVYGFQDVSLLTLGETYRVDVSWTGNTSGRVLYGDQAGTAVLGSSLNGSGGYVFRASASANSMIYAVGAAGAGESFTVTSYSIVKIPGIHATQATTANKPILRLNSGKYSWQFDGSNDSLGLSAPLFQMSDDHCVIAGFKADAANKYIFSHSNSGTVTQCCSLRVDASGYPGAVWIDDASANALPTATTSCIGLSTVATAIKIGNAKRLRVNGVQAGATNNTALGVGTTNSYAIGCLNVSSGNFQGSIYPLIGIKGTVSDAELLVLERYVGMGCGVSI